MNFTIELTDYMMLIYLQGVILNMLFVQSLIPKFIKIPFINRSMDFIDLPSIFRDKSVQSSIPNYFKKCEIPFVINIITLLGALYLISIHLFLILISKLVPLTPELAMTLNMFIRLRVMFLRAS